MMLSSRRSRFRRMLGVCSLLVLRCGRPRGTGVGQNVRPAGRTDQPAARLRRARSCCAAIGSPSRSDCSRSVTRRSSRRSTRCCRRRAPPSPRRSLSVMQKGRIPSSGDKHDYMSMAPYFWPNPATPNGLPFVNRDGEMNPESRKDHDGLRLQQTVSRVHALALAWYLTGDARYAESAAKHLRVFFLDTATRMNPNLRFAQAVLGVTEGRSYGIIDTRDMPELVDALRLLDSAPGWTQRDMDGMVAWCRAYLKWLLESKNGTEERAATNNHGVFYDEQVAALALFVGDSAIAKKTIGESGKEPHRQPDRRGRKAETRARSHASPALHAVQSRRVHDARRDGTSRRRRSVALHGAERRQHREGDSVRRAVRRHHGEVPDAGHRRAGPGRIPAAAAPSRGATRRTRHSRARSSTCRSSSESRIPTRSIFRSRPCRGARSIAPRINFVARRRRSIPRMGIRAPRTPTAIWSSASATEWTSGFFGGMLWSMYQETRRDRVAYARRALDRRTRAQQEPHELARPRLHDLRQLRSRISAHGRCALSRRRDAGESLARHALQPARGRDQVVGHGTRHRRADAIGSIP